MLTVNFQISPLKCGSCLVTFVLDQRLVILQVGALAEQKKLRSDYFLAINSAAPAQPLLLGRHSSIAVNKFLINFHFCGQQLLYKEQPIYSLTKLPLWRASKIELFPATIMKIGQTLFLRENGGLLAVDPAGLGSLIIEQLPPSWQQEVRIEGCIFPQLNNNSALLATQLFSNKDFLLYSLANDAELLFANYPVQKAMFNRWTGVLRWRNFTILTTNKVGQLLIRHPDWHAPLLVQLDCHSSTPKQLLLPGLSTIPGADTKAEQLPPNAIFFYSKRWPIPDYCELDLISTQEAKGQENWLARFPDLQHKFAAFLTESPERYYQTYNLLRRLTWIQQYGRCLGEEKQQRLFYFLLSRKLRQQLAPLLDNLLDFNPSTKQSLPASIKRAAYFGWPWRVQVRKSNYRLRWLLREEEEQLQPYRHWWLQQLRNKSKFQQQLRSLNLVFRFRQHLAVILASYTLVLKTVTSLMQHCWASCKKLLALRLVLAIRTFKKLYQQLSGIKIFQKSSNKFWIGERLFMPINKLLASSKTRKPYIHYGLLSLPLAAALVIWLSGTWNADIPREQGLIALASSSTLEANPTASLEQPTDKISNIQNSNPPIDMNNEASVIARLASEPNKIQLKPTIVSSKKDKSQVTKKLLTDASSVLLRDKAVLPAAELSKTVQQQAATPKHSNVNLSESQPLVSNADKQSKLTSTREKPRVDIAKSMGDSELGSYQPTIDSATQTTKLSTKTDRANTEARVLIENEHRLLGGLRSSTFASATKSVALPSTSAEPSDEDSKRITETSTQLQKPVADKTERIDLPDKTIAARKLKEPVKVLDSLKSRPFSKGAPPETINNNKKRAPLPISKEAPTQMIKNNKRRAPLPTRSQRSDELLRNLSSRIQLEMKRQEQLSSEASSASP